jgi:hypothetical protein
MKVKTASGMRGRYAGEVTPGDGMRSPDSNSGNRGAVSIGLKAGARDFGAGLVGYALVGGSESGVWQKGAVSTEGETDSEGNMP